MPALILKHCTSCAICESICPTFSISRGLTHFVVDTDGCEECRSCIPVCPVNAIELKPRSKFPAEEMTELAASLEAKKK